MIRLASLISVVYYYWMGPKKRSEESKVDKRTN